MVIKLDHEKRKISLGLKASLFQDGNTAATELAVEDDESEGGSSSSDDDDENEGDGDKMEIQPLKVVSAADDESESDDESENASDGSSDESEDDKMESKKMTKSSNGVSLDDIVKRVKKAKEVKMKSQEMRTNPMNLTTSKPGDCSCVEVCASPRQGGEKEGGS